MDALGATACEVLAFWFGDGTPPTANRRMWFAGGAEVDEVIRRRFGECVEAAIAGEFSAWEAEPRARLALILLLDQFPRNIFRKSPRAFAGDERASRLARDGVEQGMDAAVDVVGRIFFYLPLEHSEVMADQRRCVGLFESLAREVGDGPEAAMVAGSLDYARRHAAIIERFGRFPHRNDTLERATTAAEASWLVGGDRFGQ